MGCRLNPRHRSCSLSSTRCTEERIPWCVKLDADEHKKAGSSQHCAIYLSYLSAVGSVSGCRNSRPAANRYHTRHLWVVLKRKDKLPALFKVVKPDRRSCQSPNKHDRWNFIPDLDCQNKCIRCAPAGFPCIHNIWVFPCQPCCVCACLRGATPQAYFCAVNCHQSCQYNKNCNG